MPALSGAVFHNITAHGMSIADADLSGVSLAECNIEGMTIDGILVKDLLICYREHAPSSK